MGWMRPVVNGQAHEGWVVSLLADRAGQRTLLAVDLNGEPLAPLRALKEIPLFLGTWGEYARQDPGTETHPLRVPARSPPNVGVHRPRAAGSRGPLLPNP